MVNIERIEPLLKFEVITEDNRVLHVKSLSYEANGKYVTFFQKVIFSEKDQSKEKLKIKKYIDKIIDIHKLDIPEEIYKELKLMASQLDKHPQERKVPFLTLKNVKKINILNIHDEFNLVEEMDDEIYEPQAQKYLDSIKNFKTEDQNVSIETPINDSIFSNKDESDTDQDKTYFESELFETENKKENDFSENESLEYIFPEENDFKQNKDLPSNVEDANEEDMFDILNSIEGEPLPEGEYDFEETKKEEFLQLNHEIQSILNKLDKIETTGEGAYQSSEEQRINKSKVSIFIKDSLNEYLNRTTRLFNNKSFFQDFLYERIESKFQLTEEDVMIEICNLIKNKEININKFNNKENQELIKRNSDIVRLYNDGNYRKLLKLIQDRSNEARVLTLIDLYVYMRINNYF